MTKFLEIKSKVMRGAVVCCAMIMSGVINAYDFDPYSGQTIAIVGKVSPNYYAMRSDQLTSSGISSVASYQVAINEEGEVVFLTTRQQFYRICFKINTAKTNTQFNPYSGSDVSGYSINTSSNLTAVDNTKLALKSSNSIKWVWNTTIGTWTYTSSSDTYSFRFRAEELNFFLTPKDAEVTTSRPRGKPYLLAEHTWRTLGSSFFGTICFPKAVRAAERAGATFYEIAAKIVDGSDFKGIVLREVTGELTAGTPYIFKKIDAETTYIVAAMHGDAAASAGSSNGLVGTLTGTEEDGGFPVPEGKYILQGDKLWETTLNGEGQSQSRLLAGRAYIDPSLISTTVPYSEVAGVKGYVLGLDEPFDAVRTVKTERSSEGDIRDLQGRRVERVNSGRMYIIGGRKVLIR